MKHLLLKTSLIAFPILLLIGVSSCEKPTVPQPPNPNPTTGKTVHLDELIEDFEAEIPFGFVGFQYTIAQNGSEEHTNSFGKASLIVDGTEYDYENYHRKSLQSCSKTITAAAMIFELNKNNVSVHDSIYKYLPERWDTEAVRDITFDELLRHESGFRGTYDWYGMMRSYVEDSTFASKNYVYANVNFSMMRILIPNINEESRANLENLFGTHGEDTYEWQIAQSYLFDVRQNLMIPSGVDPDVAPAPWDTDVIDKVRHYNFMDQSLSGYLFNDQTMMAGAGGWYMNSYEFAAFLSHLMEDQFVYAQSETLMDREYGMFLGAFNGTDYYTHNGSYTSDDGRGTRALWVYVPFTKVLLTVQINSGSNLYSLDEVLQAFMQAHNDSYY
ncbi:MAG: serine hydrolase domain-containing protein [Bacteroidota bacterium]